jgi:photosystem II stability/assembly factor-like uncharacterized protein
MRQKQVFISLLILLSACSTPPGAPPAALRTIAALNVGNLDFLGVDFFDARTGWAVGDIDPRGAGGAIYETVDGGRSWRAIARTSEVLTTVHFVSLKTGWVAGDAGRIARTDDGGLTWKPQRIERQGEVLNCIFFFDERMGWAVGGSGLVLTTADGGETWNQVDTGRVEDLWSVRFVTRERGWIAGEEGLILSSTDGGETWLPLESGTSAALFGFAVASSGVAIAVGEAGTILRSDGDSGWKPVKFPSDSTLNAVSVSGSSFCAVGQRGTILNSTDEGRSWTSIAGSSRDFNSIDLPALNCAIAVGRRGAAQLLQSN